MDRLITKNTTIKLTCNVIGFDVKVNWLRNTMPLELSPRHRVEFREDGLSTLEIFSVNQYDTAEYTCVATNLYGEVCTSAYLKVYAGYDNCSPMKPQFTRGIRGMLYITNENIYKITKFIDHNLMHCNVFCQIFVCQTKL